MTHNRRQLIVELLGLAAYAGLPKLLAANLLPPTQKRRFSVPLVDDQGQVVSRYDASALYFVEDLGNEMTLDMALIPGGTFDMGSSSHVAIPPTNIREQPVHRVSVKSYGLGVFAVTVGQWRQVSTFPQITRALHKITRGDLPLEIENQLPADFISYPETDEFCKRLQQFTGRPYRLPTEAEWEYACRAGTMTKYHFGDGISQQVATYSDGIKNPQFPTPVGSKHVPNRFGLHDMHGNVLERCSDWEHDDYVGAPKDGSAWTYDSDSLSRIGRGGQYLLNAEIARSATRFPSDVRGTFSGEGLRVALDVPGGLFDPTVHGEAVVSAASSLGDPLAPGEIVTIRGSDIGPDPPASLALDERGLVSTELAGTRVLFDGIPAPLLYVSATQANAVVPYSVLGKTATQIIVEVQGQTSAPVSMPVSVSSPALFTADSSGQGQGAILNQDGSLNNANNPAPKGSIISIFGTGEGQTNPPGVDGKLAGSPLPFPVLPVLLFIGDAMAEIQYIGAAPGEIAGLFQLNARVPLTIPSGPQSIIVRVGEVSSQAGVFMVVG